MTVTGRPARVSAAVRTGGDRDDPVSRASTDAGRAARRAPRPDPAAPAAQARRPAQLEPEAHLDRHRGPGADGPRLARTAVGRRRGPGVAPGGRGAADPPPAPLAPVPTGRVDGRMGPAGGTAAADSRDRERSGQRVVTV